MKQAEKRKIYEEFVAYVKNGANFKEALEVFVIKYGRFSSVTERGDLRYYLKHKYQREHHSTRLINKR